MTEGIFIQWEVLTGIGIPAMVAAVAAIRYFWKKEKCFTAMQNKIDSLDRHDVSSNTLHDDHAERIDKIEREQEKTNAKLERHGGYLRLILDHLKIPYPKE